MRLIRPSTLLALALAAGLAAAGPAGAQTRGNVHGVVTDKGTQRPVEGATLTVVGTAISAVADANGRFALRGLNPGNYTIRVTRIGYGVVELPVTVGPTGDVTQDVAMSGAAIRLDELVVTGTAGVTEKRTVGNAITAIRAADLLENAPVRQVQELLLARAPGVTLTSYAGSAGAGSNIKIRGAGSLEAGYQPVFYIDGVRFESRNQSGIGTNGATVQGSSPFDFLNPDDIESVEVIKGPAASTLYGADAASGVVQIITKKGRRTGGGGVQWTLGSEGGQTDWTNHIGTPTNYWLCKPLHYRLNATTPATQPVPYPGCQALLVSGIDSLAPGTSRLLRDDPMRDGHLVIGDPTKRAFAFGDTARSIFVDRPSCGCTMRSGQSYKVDVSARGGGDLFNYYLSTDKYSENGIFYNNFERRIGGRANFEVTPSEKLHLGVNFAYARTNNRMPLNDNASNGILRNAFRGQAGGPGSTANGKPGWRSFSPELANQYDNRTEAERTIVGLTTSWKPISWFQNKVTVGLDKQDRRNTEFYTLDTTGRAPWGTIAATGRVQQFIPLTHTWTADYAGTISAKLPKRLSSATSWGMQVNAREVHSTTVIGEGLVANQLNLVGLAAATRSDEDISKQNSLGFFAQEQVGWRERLYATGAVRMDNNSAFGSKIQRVFYPKASLSYVISDESFFHLPLVQRLKLRTAWGKAGRAPAPFTADRTYTAARTTINGLSTNELTPQGGSSGNPDLKAETGQEIELGFDASVLNERLGIELTYYNQHTKDALIGVPDLRSSGFTGTHLENIGEIANRGLELLLTGTPIRGRNVSWDATLSFSTNHNELVSFGGARTEVQFGQFALVQRHREGYPLGGYWAVDVVRDASGRPIQQNNNIVVDSLNPYFVGPSSPTREASLSNTLTLFGNFRLYAMLDHKGGYYMWCAICSVRSRIDQNTFEVNNPAADSVDVKVAQSLQTKTWIMPADFLKLREVSVSYTMPASWVRFFRANRATITVGGRNLRRWTKYKGVGDPEVNFSSTGDGAQFNRTDYDSTPPMQYLFGSVRINF